MNLPAVSKTSILTLIYRVIETEKGKSAFNDPMSIYCYNKLMSCADDEERHLLESLKRTYSKNPRYRDVKDAIKRTIRFDEIINTYICNNPGCTVIDLACGFDTRYWRLNSANCTYIELDLPEVIEVRKKIFSDIPLYDSISCSVMDFSWTESAMKNENAKYLLVAEGLICYLSDESFTRLIKMISSKFRDSEIVVDNVSRFATRGLFRNLLRWSFKHYLKIDIAWTFSLKKPEDIELYDEGVRLIKAVKTGTITTVIEASINGSGAS